MAEHRDPERTVATPSGQPITVGLRVPGELPGGAAGLRACGIDPPTRGRRMDEALAVLRPLLAGRDVPAWQHGMHVWCGLGASPGAARDRLSETMEGFYNVPFGKFEKYTPYGTAGQIAESLRPYVEAGCRSFNLIPVADREQAAIDGAAEVRALLGAQLT